MMMTKTQKQPVPPKTSSLKATKRTAPKTFSEHIGELRRRIMWVAIVFVLASAAAYQFRDPIMQAIMAPLEGEKLIYLTPGGGFSFIFQVTMYAGLLAAAPALIHQLYGFIRPALPAHAQRSAPKVVLAAVALLLLGVSYGYFIAVPSALHFLNTFAGENILPSLTADSYLSFFLAYIGGLGLLFQLPLLLLFWHWVKPLGPGGLLKTERWVIVFAFVAAALITPTPDVVNQAMIAVPLILIYQLGVIVVVMSILKDRRLKRQQAKLQQKMQSTAHTPPALEVIPVEENTTLLQPVPLATSQRQQPRPVRQKSLDGFAAQRSRPLSIKRPPVRRLHNTASRPIRITPQLTRSIDGISPI